MARYDASGNLNLRTNGALVQTFGVSAVNELTNVTRTGPLTVSGNTPAPATNVTANGQAAQTYGDFTFASTNHSLANGNNGFTNVAQNIYGLTVTNTFTANLPASVMLQSDANGNLTNDGTRAFAYDSENQLTNVAVAGQWQSSFVYDGLNRRRIAWDFVWQSSAWVLTNEVHYIYDGYLVVREQDTNSNPLVTYTRGLDLSGSLQAAGGIGGLLARTDANGSTFYHADGAGNITALMDGNENIVARYLYSPFGKLLGQWGSLAISNEMQFSSMPQHDGLTLYPFRAYEPNFQHWLNRDPIGERGGLNLYGYVGNNPVSQIDPLGLYNPITGPNGPVGPGSGLADPSFYLPTFPSPPYYPNPTYPAPHAEMLWDPYKATWSWNGGGMQTDDGIFALLLPFLAPEASVLSRCPANAELTGAEAARAALGKGPYATPGAPLTAEMSAALQENLAAAQNSLSLANQGLNVAGNAVSAEQAAIQAATAQQRIATITRILQTGVQAPKN